MIKDLRPVRGVPPLPWTPLGGGYPLVLRSFFTSSVSVGVNVSKNRSPPEPPLVVVTLPSFVRSLQVVSVLVCMSVGTAPPLNPPSGG